MKLHIFGESHAPEIGVEIEGVPKGTVIDLDALQAFLDRRAPGNGQGGMSTPRKEPDKVEFDKGVVGGVATGETIRAVIRNTNTRPQDYANVATVPRPGHADYASWLKCGKIPTGGGNVAVIETVAEVASVPNASRLGIISSAVSTTNFLTYLSSLTSPISGIMISGSTFQSACARLTLMAARMTARVCILAISG